MSNSPRPTAPVAPPANPGDEHCGRCHYFAVIAMPDPKLPPITICRRYPPQLIPIMQGPPPRGMIVGPQAGAITLVQNQPQFPPVPTDGWCGEFIARNGA